MKECICCRKEKPVSDYYKHKDMADGHLNKCKNCCKEQARQRHHRLSKNSDWVAKERIRGREKYRRLNYKDRQAELDADRPWKKSHKYKNLNRKLTPGKGYELHHWSYKEDHLDDVFPMKIRNHRKAHSKLIFIEELLCFSHNGVVLDTREKHRNFLIENGFI